MRQPERGPRLKSSKERAVRGAVCSVQCVVCSMGDARGKNAEYRPVGISVHQRTYHLKKNKMIVIGWWSPYSAGSGIIKDKIQHYMAQSQHHKRSRH